MEPSDNQQILSNYDKIFKLTSHDTCLDDEKIISIVHHQDLKMSENKSIKRIALTPYISANNIQYTFPVFCPNIIKSKEKIVTFVGFCLNSYMDSDLITLLEKNKNYTFHFVVWGDSNYKNIESIENVVIHEKIPTDELVRIVSSSKYILSKRHISYIRFSGQLSLAMSFEKPLLIDKRTKEAYNLPGVQFERTYTNLVNLDDIDDTKYEKLLQEIKIFKETHIKKNKDLLYNL